MVNQTISSKATSRNQPRRERKFCTELGSDKVTGRQLEEMTAAINEQMSEDFCPTHNDAAEVERAP